MKAFTLDDLDERIVAAFQGGDRVSNRAVARELGVSEGAIRKRMKRLTESGAISYGLVVDVVATGLGISGWLIVEAKPTEARRVAEFIGSLDVTAVVCLTTGEASVRAYIYAKDNAAMNVMVETISRKKGVHRVEFREAVGHTQHRYELIMFGDQPVIPRWTHIG